MVSLRFSQTVNGLAMTERARSGPWPPAAKRFREVFANVCKQVQLYQIWYAAPIYLRDRAILLKLDTRPMLPFYDVPGVGVSNSKFFRHLSDRRAFFASSPHVQYLFIG